MGGYMTELIKVSTHSHPKVAADFIFEIVNDDEVSTHSHPKVAAPIRILSCATLSGFNTQPPEGGCLIQQEFLLIIVGFQHTATRRWLL